MLHSRLLQRSRSLSQAKMAALWCSILATLVLGCSAVLPSCGTCQNGGPPPMTPNRLDLSCDGPTATISEVQFASYGNPTGSCGAFADGPCNAGNSTSVVSKACLGQHACSVYPNTTTFGDPCFGTPKVLAVQFTCSDGGAGSANCADGPPPPTVNCSASVDFTTAVDTGVTLPSLQVVSQRLLLPWSGSIYTTAWASLANLTAKGLASTRFVPWIPYPKASRRRRARVARLCYRPCFPGLFRTRRWVSPSSTLPQAACSAAPACGH